MSALVRFDAYATLSPTDLSELMSLAGELKSLAKGDYLHHEGDQEPGLHLLLRGWTASSMMLPDGTRQMLKVHLPGDLIGLPSVPVTTAPDTVIALTEATVSRVSLNALGRLFSASPRLSALLFLISQEERLLLMDRLTTIGRVKAAGRFAGYVLQLHGRMLRQDPQIGDTLTTPLTQADYADLIGVTTVHVNRLVQELRRRRVIRWEHKSLTILDRPALRRLAQLPERALARNQDWLPSSG